MFQYRSRKIPIKRTTHWTHWDHFPLNLLFLGVTFRQKSIRGKRTSMLCELVVPSDIARTYVGQCQRQRPPTSTLFVRTSLSRWPFTHENTENKTVITYELQDNPCINTCHHKCRSVQNSNLFLHDAGWLRTHFPCSWIFLKTNPQDVG